MLDKERCKELSDIFYNPNSTAEDFAYFKREITKILKEDFGEEKGMPNTSLWMFLILLAFSGYDGGNKS